MAAPRATAKPDMAPTEQNESDELGLQPGVRIDEKQKAGLDILLAAHDYAADLKCDAWDFAVELAELQKVGLFTPDIRWLVHKGLVEHAHENRSPQTDRREFQHDCRLVLRKRSCFVLTQSGVGLARHIGRASEHQTPLERTATVLRLSAQSVPTWDRARQRLLVNGTIVKEFKVPAANQEQVLAAFEEEGWPVRIDDPLPPVPDQAPKLRLHTTVNALNRNQKNRLIRFSGDGRGEGIRWELLTPGANGHDYAGAPSGRA